MAMDTSDHQADSHVTSLQDVSLKASGYVSLIRDAALFAAGLMEHNPRGAATGLLWGAGSLAAAHYGNPNQEKQLKVLCAHLGEYLQKQGIAIPQSPTTEMLGHKDGIIHHLDMFMYRHPSEALNGVYTIGARQLAGSGLSHQFKPDVASGILVRAGALAGLLVQEKQPDPAHPPHGLIDQAQAWAQARPLRVSGMVYATNNIAMIWAAMARRKENPAQKSYMLRFAAAGVYILANSLLAMSSKVNDASRFPQLMPELADMAAQVVAAQPPAVQEALLQNIAGFLAAQPEIRQKPDEIAALLHQKLSTGPAVAAPDQTWQGKVSNPAAAVADVAGR
jgi:hypothetical protein